MERHEQILALSCCRGRREWWEENTACGRRWQSCQYCNRSMQTPDGRSCSKVSVRRIIEPLLLQTPISVTLRGFRLLLHGWEARQRQYKHLTILLMSIGARWALVIWPGAWLGFVIERRAILQSMPSVQFFSSCYFLLVALYPSALFRYIPHYLVASCVQQSPSNFQHVLALLAA